MVPGPHNWWSSLWSLVDPSSAGWQWNLTCSVPVLWLLAIMACLVTIMIPTDWQEWKLLPMRVEQVAVAW